jgi:excisionase family DNA binding protein
MDHMGLLRCEDAAAYLAVSESYLRKLVCRKRVPFVKLGRAVRFDPRSLDRFIARRAVLPKDWTAGDRQ